MSPTKQEWEEVRAMVKDLHAVWFGSPKDPDRPGFAERLRNLEGFTTTVKRLVWLATGAAMTSVVAAACAIAGT